MPQKKGKGSNMNTNTGNEVYKLQVAAFIIFCIGHGWNGASFSPVNDVPNTFAHLTPVLLLLLLFGMQFFTAHDADVRGVATSHWGQIGITVLAVITIIADIVLIALGQTNADLNSVGVHVFSDWVPATLTLLGSFLWLGGQIMGRQGSSTTNKAISQ
jgi:hypothetical protein